MNTKVMTVTDALKLPSHCGFCSIGRGFDATSFLLFEYLQLETLRLLLADGEGTVNLGSRLARHGVRNYRVASRAETLVTESLSSASDLVTARNREPLGVSCSKGS
jgi:hypothetical protein